LAIGNVGVEMIRVKRIYAPAVKEDGFRILVDRLWPRGMAKDKARIDLWLKEVAPSNELRTSFCHDPNKWEEFEKRYEAELRTKTDLIGKIRQTEKENGTVTLLYSAKDEEHNQAVALNNYLKRVRTPNMKGKLDSGQSE
jgi:uncharacterized protein YeaO (DUF488 family)